MGSNDARRGLSAKRKLSGKRTTRRGACLRLDPLRFAVTLDITKFTKAKFYSPVGKRTDLFMRFSTVAGERGAADAERDIRGCSVKFYAEQGNWNVMGNNMSVVSSCAAH